VSFIETLQGAPAPPEDGRQLFLTYCASCHGPNGRGGGVMSSELRHVVPDLTKFAMRNGGVFPSVRLQQIIDGTGIPSHGTREMPVWGDAFRRMRGGSEASASARIEAVTKFLESIQDRTGE
jgi:mono/diheme cytochrome c family protein